VSPRPRTIDDAEILAATARVIERVGPANLTLALVAKEVGLAPATLVQRFGSKRELLLALARSGGGETAAFVERLREEHGSPLAAAREFVLCFAALARSPEEMANHLAFLQMDLTDPAFHRITLDLFKDHQQSLERLLREAVKAGELARCETRRIARTLLALASGSLLHWAIYRTGNARDWLARDVETVLGPHLKG